MDIFGKKEDQVKPQVATSANTPKEKKPPKPRAIPKSVAGSFTDEEKALFAKSSKLLTEDEADRLIDINVKIAKLKGKIFALKIANAPTAKKISYAKCILAEEFLSTQGGKDFLRSLANKTFSAGGADALQELAKKYSVNATFKAVEKKAAKKDA